MYGNAAFVTGAAAKPTPFPTEEGGIIGQIQQPERLKRPLIRLVLFLAPLANLTHKALC